MHDCWSGFSMSRPSRMSLRILAAVVFMYCRSTFSRPDLEDLRGVFVAFGFGSIAGAVSSSALRTGLGPITFCSSEVVCSVAVVVLTAFVRPRIWRSAVLARLQVWRLGRDSDVCWTVVIQFPARFWKLRTIVVIFSSAFYFDAIVRFHLLFPGCRLSYG